jgi:predicted PurR-regulated permease PerM
MLGIDARAARVAWTTALVLLALYGIYLIRGTLVVFTVALLFAYLLYPMVDWISGRFPARSRTAALAVAYALATALIVLMVGGVGARVAAEARSLASNPPNVQASLAAFRLEHPTLEPLVTAAEGLVRDNLNDVLAEAPRLAVRLLSASGSVIYVVLVPILSFFLLKDGPRIREALVGILPLGREAAQGLLNDIHILLLQYMRALLYLCIATLVVFSIVLSLIGVPYSLLLASIAFPLEFVPMVGPLTAAVTIIAVSALSGYAHVWWVVVFLGFYRLFQDYVLSPHLMSEGVEMHPLLVIFGILAGEEIAGITGIFLSIPMLALARLGYHRLSRHKVEPNGPGTTMYPDSTEP